MTKTGKKLLLLCLCIFWLAFFPKVHNVRTEDERINNSFADFNVDNLYLSDNLLEYPQTLTYHHLHLLYKFVNCFPTAIPSL